jgi:dihydropteroate synthase
MGIINVNHDSFYAQSRAVVLSEIIELAKIHLQNGASFLDIGASSTRPGAILSNAQNEIDILSPIVKAIKLEFPNAYLSIDTYHSPVALALADIGADIINDISGGGFDANMFQTVAKLKLPYILMHIQGTPETMQQNPHYNNVVEEVKADLKTRITQLAQLGHNNVVIDPGFGFGKNLDHNYELLRNLQAFKELNLPILAGLSRKSMINRVLNCKAENALNGTTVLNTIALLNGANILRVHDVKEAVEAVKIVQQYQTL